MASSYRSIQASFASGLISPSYEGAVGISDYNAGLSIAENLFYGTVGCYRRYGTKYGTGAKSGASVLFRYWRSESCICMLEFWHLGARLLDRDGHAISADVVTQYTESELRTLSVACHMGEIYIVHQKHSPAKMTVEEGDDGMLVLSAPEDIQFVQPISKPDPLEDGAVWTEAVTFSGEGSWPSEQLFYGGRWFLFGSENAPMTVWYSRTMEASTGQYRFNDFTTEEWQAVKLETEEIPIEENITGADAAGIYQTTDMYGTRIRWALAHQFFLVGAGMSIYQYTGGTAISSVIADGTSVFSLSQAVALGAAGDKAVAYNSYVFFAGIGSHSLMCMSYSQQYSSYTGVDISGPVSDYLSSGIKTICLTEGNPAIVWVLTNDGHLLACHFLDSANMVAWSVITFTDDDHPVWIEAIESDVARYSTLFLVMKRGDGYTIETLEMVPADSSYRVPFLDCYVKSPEVDDQGRMHLPHLAGRAVEAVASKADSMSGIRYSASSTLQADASGYADLDAKLSNALEDDEVSISAGLRYTTIIGTLRSELPANGTSQSAMRAVKSITLRLRRTLGGYVAMRPSRPSGDFDRDRIHEGAIEVLYRRYNEFSYGELEELFTGDVESQMKTPATLDDRLVIFTDKPYPFMLCAIIISHSVQES